MIQYVYGISISSTVRRGTPHKMVSHTVTPSSKMDDKTVKDLTIAVQKLISGQTALEAKVDILEDNVVDIQDKFTEEWNHVGIMEAYQLNLNDLIKEMDIKLCNLEIEIQKSVEKIEELKVTEVKYRSKKSKLNLSLVCDFCDEIFNESWKLEKHMTNQHETRNYSCNKCDKSFCMKWRLKKHTLFITWHQRQKKMSFFQ